MADTKNQELPSKQEVETRKDAVFPTFDLKGQREWVDFIQAEIADFNGDLEKAADLMVSLQLGRDYIADNFSGPDRHDKPDVMIVLNESQVNAVFGAVTDANKVFVKKSLLEEYSRLDQNTEHTITQPDGTILMIGTPKQIFELHGIEESDHISFTKEGRTNSTSSNPNTTKLAEYDAQDHEYRSLERRLKYAEERNYSEKSIDVIKRRIQDANLVRSQKRSLS